MPYGTFICKVVLNTTFYFANCTVLYYICDTIEN